MINQEMKKVVDNSNKDIKELLRLDVDSKAINEEKNSTIYKIVLPQLFTCHKVDFAKNRGSANTLTDLYTESGLNKSRVERIRKVITNKIAQSLIGEFTAEEQEQATSLIYSKIKEAGFEDTVADLLAEG